jgi:hypothetical protein
MNKHFKVNRYAFTQYETNELIDAAGNRQDALDLAVLQAEGRARLYVMPASWYAYYGKNGNIVVTRLHN